VDSSCHSPNTSQQDAEFDEEMHRYLVDQADTRGAQRLRRATQPHACGFITAVPSDEDGKTLCCARESFEPPSLIASEFLSWIKQAPVLCASSLQIFGDLRKEKDIGIRHNALRNFDSVGTDALLSPVMEKKGILGNTTGRRPGDVMFLLWTESKALVIDVAVTSPLTATYERLEEPCEWYAATQKHGKYDTDFKGTQYVFCAMIFETLGAVNVEGEEVLRQPFRFAAKRLGRRAWARVSCNLQRSVVQSILNRIDGREFPDNVADA
jgi:hypothetical protein